MIFTYSGVLTGQNKKELRLVQEIKASRSVS